jgi:hypothetical protein
MQATPVPGSQAQDEVTAYVVGTVVPSVDSATTTGSKHVIGAATAGSSFQIHSSNGSRLSRSSSLSLFLDEACTHRIKTIRKHPTK